MYMKKVTLKVYMFCNVTLLIINKLIDCSVPFMARNLLDQLLVMDPAKRLTADSALDTDWLKDADFPRMLPMM